jgi:alanyl-tRNA synthetase
MPSGVIAVAFDAEQPQIFVTASPDLVERGISAGELVKVAMKSMEGRGGGRPEMAQGMGSRRDGIPAALADIADTLRTAGKQPDR